MAGVYRARRLVTTAGIALRDGRVFVGCRNTGGTQHGRWEFPGGKCDEDPTERGCLEREFLEEFELAVSVHEELGSVPFSHNDTDYLLVAYRISFDGEPRVHHAHSETRWVTGSELDALDLPQSDRVLVDDLRRRGLLAETAR